MKTRNRLSKRRHADLSIKELFAKISIIDTIFYKLLDSWESAKKTTAYAEDYARKNGLSYARPVSVIVKGDSVFKKLKSLIDKVGPSIRNFSVSLLSNILKQILDLIVLIPKLLIKILDGKDSTYDEQIQSLLDKKAGKLANTVGKFANFLKTTITRLLTSIMSKTISKSTFDPDDGNTIEIDSKFGKKRKKSDSYFTRKFHDDLTTEIQNFFKNISLIYSVFKSGDVTKGYLMLKALGRMIYVSIKQYKSILRQRLWNVIKNGGLKEALKMTAHEILDIQKLVSAIKSLSSIVGSKGKDILKKALAGLLSMLKEGISFANKIRSKNKNGMLALPA